MEKPSCNLYCMRESMWHLLVKIQVCDIAIRVNGCFFLVQIKGA